VVPDGREADLVVLLPPGGEEVSESTYPSFRADARKDPEGFWARAAEELPWLRKWDRVFESTPPTFKWFVGGRTNLAYSALDAHVKGGRGDATALVYLNERGERRTFTYRQLLAEVERAAAALRGLGLRKGDRITVYMPLCPETIALLLATVRIGAIHSVVFAGFGAGALYDRIQASGSRFVFASDVCFRKGKDVRLKEIVDAALKNDAAGLVERVVLHRRAAEPSPMTAGRDLDWNAFLALGAGQSGDVVPMESNEPAYILATSGTTARPKLAVHTHGGYQVGIVSAGRWCFGIEPGDVWWATSDIGWAVGHSYIVYGPLILGCTTVAYEGAVDHPGPETFWRTLQELRVTGLFTSPTLVRLLMKSGDAPRQPFDLSALRRVFCAGEVLNPPAWEWFQKRMLGDRIPVLDNWWQTETGGPVIGNPFGLGALPVRPGSAGVAMPGMDVSVMTPEGKRLGAGEKGILVIEKPFPSLTPTLWGEPARYDADYWGKIPGAYYTGDFAHIDADGYVWFGGRADEVIKIAAHRIGTIEVESAFLKHPAVAETGAVGRPDALRGEVIAAFVVLKQGHAATPAIREELIATVRGELGPVAVIGDLNFVRSLPKTRSGKIMRRVLRAVTLGRDPGDVTTLEDEGSVEEARAAWKELRDSLQ
jgi:acetyl-CoA synthetase